MLRPQASGTEIARAFDRFVEIVPEHVTRQQVEYVDRRIQENPLLREQLEREYETSLKLSICYAIRQARGSLSLDIEEIRALYPALNLVIHTVSIIDSVDSTLKKQIAARVKDVIKNPDAMRGIALEFAIAVHFLHRSHEILWPSKEDMGNFDFLVRNKVGVEFEVECKAFSRDIGRKVTQELATQHFERIRNHIDPSLSNINRGIFVVVTIPNRLPTDVAHQEILSLGIVRQFLSGTSGLLSDGTDIRIGEFDQSKVVYCAPDGQAKIDRSKVDEITGTTNRASFVIGRRNGCVLVVMQAKENDAYLGRIAKTIKGSASRQVSRTKGAIYVAGLQGISANGLRRTANDDGGEQIPLLNLCATEILSGDHRQHLAGIAFLSDSDPAMSTQMGSLTSTSTNGSAYYVVNRNSKYWHESLSGLFSSQN